MAKINGLFGKMRGKYGGGVFAVIKGQNILREYNPEPANPRSYAQQAQRALLANMTKFYKRGTQNYYKFAFEDKTTRESDYNAFARNNMQKGVYLSRELYDNAAVPALGNYMLTKGSISHDLQIVICGDHLVLKLQLGTNITTVGQLSAAILASQSNLAVGDIFTLVSAESDFVPPANTLGTSAPTWDTVQFFLDPEDSTLLSTLGLTVTEDEDTGGSFYVNKDINSVDRASFAALTISRVTPEGLKVSDTHVYLGATAAAMTDWYAGEYARRQAAISWGGNPEAFLAGGQLDILPNITALTVGPLDNTPFAYGLGRLALNGDKLTVGATLTGTALKTTAQGGKYKLVYYDAKDYDIVTDLMTYENRREAVLEATGTATSISLMGSVQFPAPTLTSSEQGYGVLYVDDIPVWWGLLTVAA